MSATRQASVPLSYPRELLTGRGSGVVETDDETRERAVGWFVMGIAALASVTAERARVRVVGGGLRVRLVDE